MPEQMIICPNCKTQIPLTDAISNQLKENLRNEFEAKLKEKDSEVEAKLKDIEQKEKTLKTLKASIDNQVADKLKLEREKLQKELKEKAKEELSSEMAALQTELSEKSKKLKEAKDLELQIRKEKKELEEAKQNFELEMLRRLDEEKKKIQESAIQKVLEEHRLKDADKDRLIKELTQQMEDMRRKAEQRSQQSQGETYELEIEELLKTEFQFDSFEPVGKGVKGGDTLQKVNTQRGQYCGSILWEMKRTKLWQEGWIQKLKDDQRDAKADLAVLVSETLPKGFSKFRQMDNGVWVTDFPSMISLAVALRVMITQVAKAREALAGKSEKMELVYNYLTSNEFKNRIEAIVESVVSMQKDLASEKANAERVWAKRQKQIEKVVANMVGMYGDLEGMTGTSLPSIKTLELPANEEH